MKISTVIFTSLISLLFSTILLSQSMPKIMNYQGVLKNSAGVIVEDGTYEITFKLYNTDDPQEEMALWWETKSIQVVDGILNTQLGSLNPIDLPFDIPYWLGVTVSPEPELLPRIKLTLVPYSFMTMDVMDGSITTSKLHDEAVTSQKISSNAVVKSLNGLKDNVNLVGGSNITITPDGNNLTIAAGSGSGSIGGGGDANFIPIYSGPNTISNSDIYQNPTSGNIGIGTVYPSEKLEVAGNVKVTGNFDPTGGIISSNPINIQSNTEYILIHAGNSVVKINSTGEVIITSDNISLESTGNLNLLGETVNISGSNITVDASMDLNLKGMNAKLEADMELKLKGLNVTSEAGVNNQVKGVMITVQSSGPNTIKGMPVMIN